MNFKEIETKYKADDLSLTNFIGFCASRDPQKTITAAGYDHFYRHKKDTESFCRHRLGPDMNQLTFKSKTQATNNYVRTEHNVDLAKSMNTDIISAFVKEFGYEYNFSIYKSCWVYQYNSHIFVYYIVYNVDMKELGRFVEIEMREDYDWANDQEAWNNLLLIEKLCKPLGLTPNGRIKKSLFEMYRK